VSGESAEIPRIMFVSPDSRRRIMQTTESTRPAGAPWTIRDAAAYLGVSARHLARLIEMDRIRAIRIGRRVMISDAELRRVAQEGTGE
jgi:excisionase family DNA binding protein